MNMTIRQFTGEDADGVYAAALEAWQYTYGNIFDAQFIENFVRTNYAPERLATVVPRLESGQMFFHVAVCDSQIAGFCHIGITDHGAELFRIYLRPSYIGQGIGSKLLSLGEAWAAAHGAHTLYCFVHKDNELGKQFYLRNGFRHVAERDHDDEWYMEKEP